MVSGCSLYPRCRFAAIVGGLGVSPGLVGCGGRSSSSLPSNATETLVRAEIDQSTLDWPGDDQGLVAVRGGFIASYGRESDVVATDVRH